MTNSLITKKEAVNYVDELMYYCKEEGTFEQYEWGKQLIETGEAEINADNKKDMFTIVNVLNSRILAGYHRVMALTDDLKTWKVQFWTVSVVR